MEIIFALIIIIFAVIFQIISTGGASFKDVDSLLRKVFVSQRFTNICTISSQGEMKMIRADANGENYLFVYKLAYHEYSAHDIETIKTVAGNLHIHSVVIATFVPVSSNYIVEKMIKASNISVWDYEKLYALTKVTDSSVSQSEPEYILKTSDTSDDTCAIDMDPNDPIQDGSSAGFLSKLFDRPTRL